MDLQAHEMGGSDLTQITPLLGWSVARSAASIVLL